MRQLGGAGSSLNSDGVQSALGGLSGASGGKLDLGAIVSQLDGGGLATMAKFGTEVCTLGMRVASA